MVMKKMDISELIEQYVNTMLRYKALKQKKAIAHDNYMRAKEIMNDTSNNLVSQEFIDACFKSEQEIKAELSSTKSILDFIQKSYNQACLDMTLEDALTNSKIIERKLQKSLKKYSDLKKQKEASNYAGRKYEEEYDYQVTLPFYQKEAEYKEKLKELEPTIKVYKKITISLNRLVESKEAAKDRERTISQQK